MKHHNRSCSILLFFLLTVALSFSLAPLATGMDGRTMTFPQPEIPKPQGFCGYCHILTYPDVINRSHETWKKSKHNQVGCVECHYPPILPQESDASQVLQGNEPAVVVSHIPSQSLRGFSAVELGGDMIKTIPRILDASCMTTTCHGNPQDKFQTKKIKFTEKVPFVHEPHLDKTKQIEGMRLNCTTCHQHEDRSRHFQVSESTCHLCHFANTRFNEGRSKCELCHTLPEKPIQTTANPDQKPITHQMLKEAEVSCSSCHSDLVKGSGDARIEPLLVNGTLKTVLVTGPGRFKAESCLNCHDRPEYLNRANNAKEMHLSHVTSRNARCFDCHFPIRHRKAQAHQPMPGDCRACHFDPHRYQRVLSAGLGNEDVPTQPDPMFKARTSCLGCHVERHVTGRGQTVMQASARACIQCHSKDYENMLGLWKREVGRELEKALSLEKDALEALDKYKPEITEEKLQEAQEMLLTGRKYLTIVKFGNGVHNAKYAAELLDVAQRNFKDMIDYLEGKETGGEFILEE